MIRSLKILCTLLISFSLLQCSNTGNNSEIANPADQHGKYPRLFSDNTGALFMSWMKTENDTTTLFYSKYENNIWTNPSHVSASNSWFVNWADYPSIIAYDGSPLATHWLQKKPGGTYAYDVTISPFENGAFSTALVPHNDDTPSEHGFVSMLPLSDSSFYTIWLDGRNMIGGHGSEANDHSSTLDHAMTLRGAVISADKPIEEQLIDNSVCECCSTTLARSGNSLLAAYRNRTSNEIRDIYVSRMDLESKEWTEPKNISNDGWSIAACPVNGPKLAANDDVVALVWFTGANDTAKVKLRTSIDGGVNWQETQVLETETALGRVDIEITSDYTIWATWMSRTEDSAVLKLASFDKNGTRLTESVLTEVSPSRSAGFPQLELIGATKMIAWTDVSGDLPRIRTMLIQ